MFKADNPAKLFTSEKQVLNNEQQKVSEKTPEKTFCKIVLSDIKESDYKAIFSNKQKKIICFCCGYKYQFRSDYVRKLKF
jgi:redox-regulated HSP33 family molecular chaperone